MIVPFSVTLLVAFAEFGCLLMLAFSAKRDIDNTTLGLSRHLSSKYIICTYIRWRKGMIGRNVEKNNHLRSHGILVWDYTNCWASPWRNGLPAMEGRVGRKEGSAGANRCLLSTPTRSSPCTSRTATHDKAEPQSTSEATAQQQPRTPHHPLSRVLVQNSHDEKTQQSFLKQTMAIYQ